MNDWYREDFQPRHISALGAGLAILALSLALAAWIVRRLDRARPW